jgi:UDP-GlcNAc:undecaprenyl-phosphate GlcNAc-1-phosphate transferase
MFTLQMLIPLLLAFLVTVIATPLLIPWIKKWGFVDDPKTHKHPAMLHTKPIPRAGGISLFLGVFVASLFFVPLNGITIALFIASLIALITGVIDDKYDLSPYVRFGINFLCAIIVVASGISIPFITNPYGGILQLQNIHFGIINAGQVLAVLWIVWVMNMLNWSKGVDGQMPGIVAISAFVIGLLALRFPLSEPLTVIASNLSFIITGSALGFLVYNFYPAKIFPGYGATAIYLLLASVSMLSSVKLATAVLVMGVPMIDGAFTILRRIFSRRSPFKGDKKHLHHLLFKLGFNQRGVALFYWTISAIVGAAALTLSSKGKLFAIFMMIVVIGGGLLFLHLFVQEKHEK